MLKTIEELSIAEKHVLIRVDFNTPLKQTDGVTVVADNTRIREALPTIEYALSHGAKVVLASHLGRPQGYDPKFSLEPVAKHLSEMIKHDVLLTDDCVGDGVQMIIRHLKASHIILLENLRFHPEEEKNDPSFCKSLASLCDIYITDAFGTTHRKHASTYGVPQLMATKGCGFLIKKEIHFLDKLLKEPQHPFVVILGGSKVVDKIKTIESLFLHANSILIGGAMAHAFQLAMGSCELFPNTKRPSEDEISHAKDLLQKAKINRVEILLPVDEKDGFDIGPKTINMFVSVVEKAETVFWNGPVGVFEKPEYAAGSLAIAEAIAKTKGLRIVGGGDTVSVVNLAGVASEMDHLSTGGGATLEYLEGKGLPGIDVLKK